MFLLEHNTYHPFYHNMRSANYIDVKHNANINLIRFTIIMLYSSLNVHYTIFNLIIFYYIS